MKLSEKQLIILEALARFKYLTSQQLQQIFGKKSCSYINSAIRKLRLFKPTLIRSIDFGVIA
ncbi:MAG: hypothetical protein GY808_19735 [Gammaproteobacteria bacterium]|nr:hypothetical protein [Gammaproteobacteria bacterium]